MRELLKEARKILKDSVKDEYIDIINNAKVTPFQEHLLDLHIIKGLPLLEVADRVGYSESCVRHQLSHAYEHVARVIDRKNI